MFEDKHNNIEESDILMRSIFSEAQEEVPAHVWEGISAELDKIDSAKSRRPVVLWLRRSAVAVAAAAAVTVGVFVNRGGKQDLVPVSTGSDMIAVVENNQTVEQNAGIKEESSVYIADAAIGKPKVSEPAEVTPVIMTSEPEETATENIVTENTIIENTVTDRTVDEEPVAKEPAAQEYFPEVWPEDETVKTRRQKTSIVLSGLAGTNSAQNNSSSGPLRRPSISSAPVKTGIRQTSTESTYGLPVSVGVGVKVGLSQRWALGTGVNYTYLTRKFYGTYTHVSNDGAIDKTISSDIRNSQHYIGIPINAYYSIIDRDHVNFYTYFGGAVEKCVRNKYDVLSTPVLHTEKVKGVQFSANLGVGVEFILGKHIGLYVDPSLHYYFDNGQPASIRTAQPLMLGFEMGLRFNL